MIKNNDTEEGIETLNDTLSIIEHYFQNFENENINKKSEKHQDDFHFIYCNGCDRIPEISCNDLCYIDYECECSHIIYLNIKHFIKYLEKPKIEESKQNIVENDYSMCQKHLMALNAYCVDCSCEICEDCYAKKDTNHFNHKTLKYSDIYNEN